MKMKKILWMAVVAMMPLVACSKAATKGSAGAESQAVAEKANLGFLEKLGVDVSNIHTLGDPNDSVDYNDIKTLTVDQVLALVPMARTEPREMLEDWYDLVSARALPGGYTMLLFSVQTGDDSSEEMLGIYDKDGKLTDMMQLGDMEGFVVVDWPDASKQGTAQATDIKLRFDKPNEMTIEQTDKEGSWTVDEESRPSELTNLKWLLQTVRRYAIDDEGHLKLIEEKEVKREGTVAPDCDPKNIENTIWKLSMLPIGDPGRVDLLNERANELIKKHGKATFDEEMAPAVQMVLEDYYKSNPETVLMWVYNHRNEENVIVEQLKGLFTEGGHDKKMLAEFIGQLPDKTVKDYLSGLTARW